MKKILFTLTAVYFCVSLLAGCGASAAVPGAVSAASAPEHQAEGDIPPALLALRFDGYENMNISEYRSTVFDLISQHEETYFAMIERVSTDSAWEAIRYTDADAYFIKNVLLPTVAEKWTDWTFNNSCGGEDYLAEYTVRYSILDAEHVTMGQRNRALSAVMDGVQAVLDGRTEKQLADEDETRKALHLKMDEITDLFTTDSFQIQAELHYKSWSDASAEQTGAQTGVTEKQEAGTEADYRLLLSLKTDGYETMRLSDFLDRYIQLAQDPNFQAAYTRVANDLMRQELPADITDDEVDFLRITLEATSREFLAKYQNTSPHPSLSFRIEKQRTGETNGHNILFFEFFLDYRIQYSIQENADITVGERDTALRSVKHALQSFVDHQTEDELAQGQAAVTDEIESLEQQYGNTKIDLDIQITNYKVYDQRQDAQSLK